MKDSKELMTKMTDLDAGKTNNPQQHFWEHSFPSFPSLCLFQRKKVQYETSADRDFTQWDVLPSFRLFHTEA